jgi:N-acetyl-gamma-glutamyl-phosphate reductase
MEIRAAILGGSGFAGAELLRLCAGHPNIRPVTVFGDSQAGQSVRDALPHLALAYPELRVERFSPERLEEVDLVFAALPHGESQRLASEILGRNLPFVDLGADFRLKCADDYATWYGEPHGAPELIGRFVYGLPEIGRDALRGATAVAAPGCYPTAAILALKPLIDAGLVEPHGIVVDAMSGVSGAGRGLKPETHFCTVDESVAAYGLLSHRHTAEMEQALSSPEKRAQVLFTPHLVPMNRGMLATCHGAAARLMQADEPLEALRATYADEPFIVVSDRPPQTKWTLGSNAVHLTARYDARTGRVLAIAALDNLVKGAAGQMLQCANLMLGLPETAGLPTCGVYP